MRLIYIVMQCSWGIIQTCIGFLVFLFHLKDRHYFYNGAIVTEWHRDVGLSLGLFVFVWPDDKEVLSHEYGHTIQSLLLGPLYLLVIGIPSFVWCNLPRYINMRKNKNISYDSFYPERWANILGEKVSKKDSSSV